MPVALLPEAKQQQHFIHLYTVCRSAQYVDRDLPVDH